MTAASVRRDIYRLIRKAARWRKGMVVPHSTTATSTTTPADAVRVAVGAAAGLSARSTGGSSCEALVPDRTHWSP